MKQILIAICSILLPILSLKIPNAKLCIHCKHFIPHRTDNTYAKCSAFLPSEYEILLLITGIEDPNHYYYCSTTRGSNYMCGKEGKQYIPADLHHPIPNNQNNKTIYKIDL